MKISFWKIIDLTSKFEHVYHGPYCEAFGINPWRYGVNGMRFWRVNSKNRKIEHIFETLIIGDDLEGHKNN